MAVRMLERASGVARDLESDFHRQGTLPLEFLAEGVPFYVRHHEVDAAVDFSGIQKRKDVGVGELGSEVYFEQKAFRGHSSEELLPEQLERDLASIPQVLTEVYEGGGPAPEFPLNAIAVLERSIQEVYVTVQ